MSVEVFYSDEGIPRFYSSQPTNVSQKCTLTYLNEGGANFVFQILPGTDGLELPSHIRGKLLRLRKDLSHVQSAKEQLAAFDEHFKPLLPSKNLVQSELIQLDQDFANLVNVALNGLKRPSHRVNDFLPLDEKCGLLVTDMTPQKGEILLQLKPKWLAQSPNAPQEAKRCRTCALRALRASQKKITATDAQGSCPLALISDITVERERSAQRITDDTQLQEYLIREAQPLFHTLRTWQTKLDASGIFNCSTWDSISSYCKAMTLRDCTLFLKRSKGHIEARVADLDLKQPEKLASWKSVEQQLIAEGWYTNDEIGSKWSREEICLLSR